MAADGDEASFTFSWLALKLLGRGLYSNPWSALSELVANGLDALADDVYVYVDARDKANATVEVIDTGSGMSRADINVYVKVGHNKRRTEQSDFGTDTKPKGRKGIGKLAALFLSPHFYLSTRHADGSSSWELDARDGNIDDNENPSLVSVGETPSTPNDELWSATPSGTRITMLEVDLTGYGPQAISALGTRLANQFLLPVSSTPRILLWVQSSGDPLEPAFEPVAKSIAFNNLSDVSVNFPDSAIRPIELASGLPELTIPAPGLPGGTYSHTPTSSPMRPDPTQEEDWDEVASEVDLQRRTYRNVPFVLTGWIGVHATIDSEPAKRNDARFMKNKYYNPAQIRVYVRGKLASDHLLTQLGFTGTYANYIEGEISFDLLDDDSLPDIATSNRQDFDETDKRVTLLRALVRPVVRALIRERNNLAGVIGDEVKREKARRETASKRHFSEQLQADLDHHDEIPQPTKDELQMVITNKIQGDVLPKQSYLVFISHASPDRAFAALIDELLRARGANPDEIFYTSRTGSTDQLLNAQALSQVVKRSITADNTLIFYVTSKNFLSSQFCLFEGGAGWATRGVSEYLKLNVEFDAIPGWLTNGRGEAILLDTNNAIELTPQIHNYLIEGVLNPMIMHLNRGRDIAGGSALELFVSADFPSSVEMLRVRKTPEDYFDPTIREHWTAVVDTGLVDYLESYFRPSHDAMRVRELEEENIRLQAILDSQTSH